MVRGLRKLEKGGGLELPLIKRRLEVGGTTY